MIDNLPKVRGLSSEQQTRLDAELNARHLTTLGSMRARPMELLAAWQYALGLDIQAILAAYGDAESQALQAATDKASVEAANIDYTTKALPVKRGRVGRATEKFDIDKDESEA